MGMKFFLTATDGEPEALVSRLRTAGHSAGIDQLPEVWFVPSGDYSHMEDWAIMIEGHFKCSFLRSAPIVEQG